MLCYYLETEFVLISVLEKALSTCTSIFIVKRGSGLFIKW